MQTATTAPNPAQFDAQNVSVGYSEYLDRVTVEVAYPDGQTIRFHLTHTQALEAVSAVAKATFELAKLVG